MSTRTFTLSEELHSYLLSVSVRSNDVLQRLREETAQMPRGGMQISAEQGQFMDLLVKLLGARKVLEIGVFTGYSSLVVAQALPEDGRIIACDVSEEFTSVARRYWAEAGVAHKIDLRLGPALETVGALLDAGEADTFDFAFIDADKSHYDSYYEAALRLVRPGGMIGIDNTLWSGKVTDPSETDADTVALRALNEKLHQDARIDLSLVPIGDGLTLCRKR